MILFHASFKKFNIGEKLIANANTPYFLEKQQKNQEWVDIFLNEQKPLNAPDRQHTFFACDAIENCHAFISSKTSADNAIYYKVEMCEPTKAVMCITDLILKAGAEDSNIANYANEYWKPSLDWKYFEYLSNEMQIIEIVEAPHLMVQLRGKENYSSDFDLRRKTFGK